MLPPDVEPIDPPRRGDAIILALVAALSGGLIGLAAGLLIGRGLA